MYERLRVIVMDDDTALRNTACRMLESMGLEAEAAKNGTDTINLYKKAMEDKKQFDIVIMDLNIPGDLGGKDVIKILLKSGPGIKAIISSGERDDPAMVNPQDYGFIGALPKPYTLQELSKVIHSLK